MNLVPTYSDITRGGTTLRTKRKSIHRENWNSKTMVLQDVLKKDLSTPKKVMPDTPRNIF